MITPLGHCHPPVASQGTGLGGSCFYHQKYTPYFCLIADQSKMIYQYKFLATQPSTVCVALLKIFYSSALFIYYKELLQLQ